MAIDDPTAPLTPTLFPEYRGAGENQFARARESSGEGENQGARARESSAEGENLGVCSSRGFGENQFFAHTGALGSGSDPPATAAQGPEQAKAGRPGLLDEFNKGKLLLALAAGLSRHEAASCVGCSYWHVRYLLQHDSEFAEELRLYAEQAGFHPHLVIFSAAGKSWKGAVSLLEHWQIRRGVLTTDRLLAALNAGLELALRARR